MKPSDLRIGNYLHDRDNNLCKVIELTGLTINAPVIDWPVTGLPHKPIELTEEWLLNLGFNKEYKSGYIGIDISNNDFVLTYPDIMGEFQKSFAFEFKSGGWAKFKQIEFVHDLQNFFHALTGKELTINI